MAATAFGAAVLLVFLAAGAVLGSQHDIRGSHSELRAIPIELLQRLPARRDDIGTAHESVSTASREAQAWYDQGLAHLHSFAWIDAARAFHAALGADSRLAIAHVGLSFAFGGLGSSSGAAAELQRAHLLEASAGAHDKLRIALRAMQLSAVARPGDASAMSAGEAAVPFYARALKAAPDYFAPHHYLAHAYENMGRIDLALEQSRVYLRLAPGVPHAHHMYGHALRRTGRPMEAIQQFQRAADIETTQFKAAGIPSEYDWHHHHNTTLLAATYRYVGQMRSAADVLRRAFDEPAPLLREELNKREW